MSVTKPFLKLTYEGANKALQAAVRKAEEIGAPQCITIVDDGGNLMAFARMDGSKTLSIQTSMHKALTSASHRMPSNKVNPDLAPKFAVATGGKVTNLAGGLPIVIDGHTVGAVGVGSGSPEEDIAVAKAALTEIGATDPLS
jgi:glc operon protein GlcG